MSVNLLQPVILVVKAPNQQIADQTVECAWDWTIRKLKDHLASVYPSKPRQEQQKLIYYGRLLLDHLTLKDVLKQYDDGQSTHTVHLVCSGAQHNTTTTKTEANNTTNSESPRSMDTDGLRRRNTAPAPDVATSQSPSQTSSAQSPYHAFYQQQMAQMAAYAQQYPQMNAYAQNPQMMMYQQMYAQQMSQYMQYWQSLYQAAPPLTPAAPSPLTPASAAPVQAAPAAAAAPPRREQQNPVMNAGAGGAAMFDDDEDQEQDWLDWFYTGCRFTVLVMIIYFYSTIPRAVVGLMFFFFIYFYQQGWFNGAQPPPADVNAAPEPAPAPAPEPAQHADPAGDDNQPAEAVDNAQNDENQESVGEENHTSDDSGASPEPELDAAARLHLTWTFFKTFFTSLLPRPQAVA